MDDSKSQPEDMVDSARQVSDRWGKISETDRALFIRKAKEYGSTDLDIMGLALERMLHLEEGKGVEAAIGFYALGKIARAVGAWADGRQPSDDTWQDLTIYSMMARTRRE